MFRSLLIPAALLLPLLSACEDGKSNTSSLPGSPSSGGSAGAGGTSGPSGAGNGGGGTGGASTGAGGALTCSPATASPPADGVTGPYQWKNVAIVGGGFVSGIVFSTAQCDLAYARTDVGGAYRWDAAVRRWSPLTDWLSRDQSNQLGIESIAPDPVNASRVYLAAGTYLTGGNGFILRSDDQGQTFNQSTQLEVPMGGNADGRSMGERLAVDPNKPDILYFGARQYTNNTQQMFGGLFTSVDAGAHFARVASFPATGAANIGIAFVLFDRASGSAGAPTPVLYVGVADTTTGGLYRSTDAGASFTLLPNQRTGLMVNHGALGADGMLYLTYGNLPGPNSITDGAVYRFNPRDGSFADITPLKPQPGSVQLGYGGVSIDPSQPGTLMVSTIDWWRPDDVFRSTDGGATWRPIASTGIFDPSAAPWVKWHQAVYNPTGWMGDIEIDPFHPGRVLYITGQGIWGSEDMTSADMGQPTHWSFESKGIEETVVLDLMSPPSGAELISAVGDIGGFRHDDVSVTPADGMSANPIFGNTTSVEYAELAPAIMARVGTASATNATARRGAYSTDGGVTWIPFPTEPAAATGQTFSGQGTISLSADGSTMIWTATQTNPTNNRRSNLAPVYTRDHGVTWSPITGLSGTFAPVADRVNPNKFYAYGRLPANSVPPAAFFVSNDGGATFSMTSASLPAGTARVRALPGVEGDVWVDLVANNARTLNHSIDSGVTWTTAPTVDAAFTFGFGAPPPGQTYPAIYLVGTVSGVTGVFRSDDAAASFARIDDDRHRFSFINVIVGDPKRYGRVYVGTGGRGILYGDPVATAQ